MFKTFLDQWASPPKSNFNEENVPSQAGRVFIVTGATSGIGFELAKILYGKGAKIYLACRSKERAEESIRQIRDTKPQDPGALIFLPFDLNDLESVKTAAAAFQKQEEKLDVLWNNAGCGPLQLPVGSRTAQGFESLVGMHVIATFLFTKLLHPQLKAAAATSPPGSVRVMWTSSIAIEGTPKNGIEWDYLETGKSDRDYNYGMSKVGSWFLGYELSRRWASDGIISLTVHPGMVVANSYENKSFLFMKTLGRLLHETKYGAYTQLYAGLSQDITPQNSGAYILPWGRIQVDEDRWRRDIPEEMKREDEGGRGGGKRLWEWCEEKLAPYL
ncbi:hypothetical protein BX600DRAFT_540271 [Xylariales sp. PMI_506]|nr:hypothetical protein BX600DRAFT_540271 [Xylariales sp. PMI_506]